MLCENAMDIEGYEGKYAVTTDGRIYSHSRVMNNPRSDKGSLIKGRWMKLITHKKGYLAVGLTKDCVKKTAKVHRLVAMAFIPNPENKPQVNHIDGDKTNNCVENLEWATDQENIRHAFDTGLNQGAKGEACHLAKYTEEQVLAIRADSRSSRVVAKEYGMSKTNVLDIRSRKIWAHI